MPRQARKESGTGVYHVMLRGINRQNIYDDDEDHYRFMDYLHDLPLQYDEHGNLLPERSCCLYAWCLMGNHCHLLIKEIDSKIGRCIKSLADRYVYYYNKKNFRIGHLFQDRFKSEPCNDMNYFTTLLRYIHQNPVKAGIVQHAEDYKWSSWSLDYLNQEQYAMPISSIQPVLKRYTIAQLKKLIDEPCDA